MSRTQRRFRTSYRHIRIQRGESRHHRKCRCNNGGDEPSNISVVSQSKHDIFHAMFGCMTPPEIAEELNKVWLDKEYKFICIHNKRKE
jgi:hypothetical protein